MTLASTKSAKRDAYLSLMHVLPFMGSRTVSNIGLNALTTAMYAQHRASLLRRTASQNMKPAFKKLTKHSASRGG